MPYLNLTSTNGTDAVNPITALNNNWDQIDSKFKTIDSGSSPVGTGVTNPQQGQEFVKSTATSDVGVYTGAVYKTITTTETWGAWTSINLAANYSAVSGKTPQLRLSSLGKIECRGAIQYQTGTTAWPTGYQQINSAQFPSSSYGPGQVSVQNTTATPLLSTTNWCYGQVFIGNGSGFLSLFFLYQGSIAASGNYICIDSVSWYAG